MQLNYFVKLLLNHQNGLKFDNIPKIKMVAVGGSGEGYI